MKVLVIRFSSIGDIVLTTPIVRCIKTQRPDVSLHFVTKQSFAWLWEENPYLDGLHLLEDSIWELAKSLRKEKFDAVIDLHNNARSRYLTALLGGIKTVRFNKLNIEKFLLTTFKINRLPNIHIVERYIETAAFLGVRNDHAGLDYFIPTTQEYSLRNLPESHQSGFVAIAIGGQHTTKKLPVSRLIELCEKINRPIVLLGGKEDLPEGTAIAKALGSQVLNFSGALSFHQSASLVAQAEVVYTHDTGLMHVAAAFKRKTVSIWGNTVPDFGMYPYRTQYVAWQVENLSCRPCSKIGHNACPKGHFKCMNDQVFTFPPFPEAIHA